MTSPLLYKIVEKRNKWYGKDRLSTLGLCGKLPANIQKNNYNSILHDYDRINFFTTKSTLELCIGIKATYVGLVNDFYDVYG